MSTKFLTVALILIVIYLTNVANSISNEKPNFNLNEKLGLGNIKNPNTVEIGRRRRPFGLFGHGLGHGFGIPALAILYWLKVKAIIIAFIVGTAIVWGSKYYFASVQKCQKESHIIEGPITFDHGHPWSSGHHDHISYSAPYSIGSDSNYFSSENSPYSAYGSPYSGSSPPSGTDIPYVENHHDKKWKRDTSTGKQFDKEDKMEEGLSELAFIFLGVGSNPCKRRFVCEWEFHSKRHPLTRMIFRVVGRSIFKKYARDPNDDNEAKSFHECARANSECVFIEEHISNNEITQNNEENENKFDKKSKEKNDTKTSSISDTIAETILKRKL